MKHIKEYNQYNEAWFDSTSKFPLFTEYDKIVRNLFNRMKATFNVENFGDSNYSDQYIYRLEETDSIEGFIEINIHENFNNVIVLRIDDEEIPCSLILRHKIYNFLKKKWKNRGKLRNIKRDKEKIQNFKKKFGNL